MSDDKVVKRITEQVAEILMKFHGWDKDNPLHRAEWNPDIKDSQYSMMYEDAELTVKTTIEALQNYVDDPDDFDDDDLDLEAPNEYFAKISRPSTTITSSAAMFIFCDAGVGNPMYVSDVRNWLSAVDRAGIPDDTEVEGSLHLSFDIRNPNLERIECGECGHKDVLITEHSCRATEEDERK